MEYNFNSLISIPFLFNNLKKECDSHGMLVPQDLVFLNCDEVFNCMSNEEIMISLIYRLYFFADECKNSSHMPEYLLDSADMLKKLCAEQIYKRDT